MAGDRAILETSIHIQTIKVEVDPYDAKPEETLIFNLDTSLE